MRPCRLVIHRERIQPVLTQKRFTKPKSSTNVGTGSQSARLLLCLIECRLSLVEDQKTADMKSLLFVVLLLFSAQVYSSEDDPCRDARDQCGHEDGDVTVDVGDVNVDVDEGDTNVDVRGGEQNVTINNPDRLKTTGRAFIGGGSSSDSCQKVRAIGSGWLGGALSIRWDGTVEECYILRMYAIKMVEGNARQANRLWCTLPIMKEMYGRNGSADCFKEATETLNLARIVQYEPRYEEHAGHSDHEEHLMADVTQEEYEEQQEEMREQQEKVADKQVQQQNLIESQAEEIIRLRREAEALKRQQEYRSAQRAQAVMDLSALKSTASIEEEDEPENE